MIDNVQSCHEYQERDPELNSLIFTKSNSICITVKSTAPRDSQEPANSSQKPKAMDSAPKSTAAQKVSDLVNSSRMLATEKPQP